MIAGLALAAGTSVAQAAEYTYIQGSCKKTPKICTKLSGKLKVGDQLTVQQADGSTLETYQLTATDPHVSGFFRGFEATNARGARISIKFLNPSYAYKGSLPIDDEVRALRFLKEKDVGSVNLRNKDPYFFIETSRPSGESLAELTSPEHWNAMSLEGRARVLEAYRQFRTEIMATPLYFGELHSDRLFLDIPADGSGPSPHFQITNCDMFALTDHPEDGLNHLDQTLKRSADPSALQALGVARAITENERAGAELRQFLETQSRLSPEQKRSQAVCVWLAVRSFALTAIKGH